MKNIVLLNGPSSAGKSTLSRELQERLEGSVIISIDDYMTTDPRETIYEDDIYEIMPAMCRDIKEYVRKGKTVIIDHAITSERIYDMFLDAAKEGDALTVKVVCDIEILRQRELARGDRCPGSAEASLEYLWPKEGYDLTVDNGKIPVSQNADLILKKMRGKKVIVLPYDEAWKDDFEKIRAELADALGDLALRIEHVGSTSVPGLSAKPVIDIDVVIKDNTVLNDAVAALAKIGYFHEGDLGIKGREAFGYEGKEHLKKHHLYVCPEDSPELKRHITFRDYLRSHPEAVREYGRIKEEGAALFPEDIDKYMNYKAPVINKIYEEMNK